MTAQSRDWPWPRGGIPAQRAVRRRTVATGIPAQRFQSHPLVRGTNAGRLTRETVHLRAEAPTVLKLWFLGDTAVQSVTGPPIMRFRTQKALALFAYVAMQRRQVPRQELAHLLWTDVQEDQAFHSLRQALFEVRIVLGPDHHTVLHSDRWLVSIDARRVRVDAHTFEKLVLRGTPRALRHACAVYKGELLPGLHTRERAFHEWLASERTRLKQLAIGAHQAYLQGLIDTEAHDESVRVAQALIRIVPFDDWVHRALAHTYARTGHSRIAIAHLQGYVEMLRQASRSPERETLDLLDALASRRLA